MLNSIGYQIYSQPNSYDVGRSIAHRSAPSGEKDEKQSDTHILIPGSEQEAYLIDKFGEKKLKELEIIPCETCTNRKYQDGSDDPGVSFKTPQHIAPGASGAAVMAHENEHVVRERVQAESEGREVVSRLVTLNNSVCSECGRVYVAGGKTRTTTKAKITQTPVEQFVGNLFDMKL